MMTLQLKIVTYGYQPDSDEQAFCVSTMVENIPPYEDMTKGKDY